MSIISAGTATTSALVYTADISGNLILQANGANKAVTIDTSLKLWQQVDTSITKNYHNFGDGVINYAAMAGSRDSANTGHLELYTLNNGTTTEAVRIDASGNLIMKTGSIQELKSTIAANNINLATGTYFTKTISGTTTLTVSNVAAANSVSSFILDLTNGGSATVTWWSGVKWAAGTSPTLTASGRDVLGFFTHDGGTTWNGLVLAKDIK